MVKSKRQSELLGSKSLSSMWTWSSAFDSKSISSYIFLSILIKFHLSFETMLLLQHLCLLLIIISFIFLFLLTWATVVPLSFIHANSHLFLMCSSHPFFFYSYTPSALCTILLPQLRISFSYGLASFLLKLLFLGFFSNNVLI